MAINLEDFEYYLGTLDEEDLDDVLWAIDPATSHNLRYGVKLDLDDEVAIDNLDDILTYSPKTSDAMVLFKAFEGEQFRQGGELKDAGFLTGQTTMVEPGPGNVVLAISVPKGSSALYLSEGSWVLPRNYTLMLRGADHGPIEAKLV